MSIFEYAFLIFFSLIIHKIVSQKLPSMTPNKFQQLSKDLQSLVKIIPLNWGAVQNDSTDCQINMFKIDTFSELEQQIASLTEASKSYFRRRWFLWKNAQCDEYLFCLNKNVIQNPNAKDQSYDLEFNANSQLRFDLKGTIIPRGFRNKIEAVVKDPTEMIQFFYDNQSVGVRNKNQNRLFLVHHSFKNQEREMPLRCNWDFKKEVYEKYAEKITSNANFISYKEVKSDVIFLFENEDNSFTSNFFAV